MTAVWECQDLSGSEKLTMLAMADWCNDQGESLHPSMRGIAKKIGASECQARRIVHYLIDSGFLLVIGNHQGGNPGQARQYKVIIQRLKTPSVDATPITHASPRIDASPITEATPSMDARDPYHPCAFTPSVDATLTVSEPLVNHQSMSGKPDVVLSNGKQKFKAEAEIILNFLNEKSGRRYRPLKANLDFIAERLKEGATPDECRQIIAKKSREWKGTDMEEYLRPATLFNRTKFAQYQGELV